MIYCVNAILLVDLSYVLQLRDDNPMIAASGQWSLFGGGVEDAESPKDAIVREITEELSVPIENCQLLGCAECYGPFEKQDLHFSFFVADITSFWGKHQLTEGQDVALFNIEEIQKLSMPKLFLELINNFHNKRTMPLCDSCNKKTKTPN
jgi:8-oxo-dGTP pyrophosphatase MutT (NUDIX family)